MGHYSDSHQLSQYNHGKVWGYLRPHVYDNLYEATVNTLQKPAQESNTSISSQKAHVFAVFARITPPPYVYPITFNIAQWTSMCICKKMPER